ncbi:MAG: (2Fe-2S)-binding protein [Pseudomonadota bacterium]
MFQSIDRQKSLVEVRLDGELISLAAGIPLAAALLEQEITLFRLSPVSGSARAPYCMIGNCYECMIEIDGIRQRSCRVTVREGMDLRRCLEGG